MVAFVTARRGRLNSRAVLLALAATWLVFCTYMFHGVLEVQLTVGSTAEVRDTVPGDSPCSSWFLRSWCLQRRARHRAESVRQGMMHAWAGYKAFAWGADEIHPYSKTAKTDIMGGAGVRGMGVSIVDALSTLKLMGLDEQFREGRNWVMQKLDFNQVNGTISFFETVIRILGGLVAAYDLSGDQELRSKAVDLGERLVPAFASAPTGLISNNVNLPRVIPDDGSGQVILAEMGSNVLEFASVARLAGNDSFRTQAEKGLRAVHAANDKALMLESVDRLTGKEAGWTRGVGAGTDSYYEYLIKYWVLGGRQDEHFRSRWEAATDDALAELLIYPKGWPFSYASDSRNGALDPILEHLRCFYPGSIALGVMSGAVEGMKAGRYLEFAANMTHACFQLYNATASGLGAERIQFDPESGQISIVDGRYWQRPEVIESIFYMWRATHEERWRDMGWQMWRAIERYARWEGGYSGATDANQVPPQSDDVSQSWFFAETLKYFYLLFSPDAKLSLAEWVLNTEAHPLRAYRPGGGGGSVRQRLKTP